MKIRLEPVSDKNREAVLKLTVREDQPFVAPNDVSLRQADEANAEDPGVARPFAIYADEKLVGFCMFAFDPEEEDPDDRYWLWRFMIDRRYQGNGYGRQAMKLALDFIRTFPAGEAKYCWLSFEPKNEVARNLYRSLGFEEHPEQCDENDEDDEMPAILTL